MEFQGSLGRLSGGPNGVAGESWAGLGGSKWSLGRVWGGLGMSLRRPCESEGQPDGRKGRILDRGAADKGSEGTLTQNY